MEGRLTSAKLFDVDGDCISYLSIGKIGDSGHVRCGHDVGQGEQRVIRREWLRPEDIRAGSTQVPAD